MMKPEERLENHIRALVEIGPTGSKLISCFVNLEHPRTNYALALETKFQALRGRLRGEARQEFDWAFGQIVSYLDEHQAPRTRGAAIHVRVGDDPLFLPIEFEVPLETEVFVDDLPHIYPLIALKDTYHRFVTVVTTERGARIFETTLGAISEEILTERKDLRKRIGREWTREHYQNHKHEREQQLIREKIQIIDGLMRRRGHNHLVIAGSPAMVGRMTTALPPRLKDKLISTFNTNPRAGINPILLEAVQLFVEAENAESHDRVRKLRREMMTTGLGVSGYDESLAALEGGYADMLLIGSGAPDTPRREQLMRLAASRRVGVETVRDSEVLNHLGGVGCLLRYRPDGLVSKPQPRQMAVALS
ncbi:MAG: hypothetical protein ACR2RV_23470 [Verrucomicrobiales bacterium]